MLRVVELEMLDLEENNPKYAPRDVPRGEKEKGFQEHGKKMEKMQQSPVKSEKSCTKGGTWLLVASGNIVTLTKLH